MSACPSPESLEQFLSDQLSGADEQAVSRHVEHCPACQQHLEARTQLTRPVRRPGQTEASPEPEIPRAFLERLQGTLLVGLVAGPARETHSAELTVSQPAVSPAYNDTRPVLAGYEILGELGRGGMGVVYKARQTGLRRLVALKMILDGAQASAEHRARFRREAEAVGRLQHPNVVQIYDVGEQAGRPYFAMEYVDGPSLAQCLKGAPQPPRAAAELVQTLALAVQAAHERGVVHRDLKPANILLLFSGEPEATARVGAVASGSPLNGVIPKITDFGLAKPITTADAHGMTQSGAILGSPSYMAPEQAAGQTQAVGAAADVYALGAILYELLTGRPPFRGATPLDTLLQVRHEEPVAPRRLVPGVPRDLETICLKCLEKTPGRRYAAAGALAEDARRFLAGEPVLARPSSVWERGLKWARRRPAWAALVVVCVAAFLGSLLGSVWLNQARRAAEEQRLRAEGQQARALANLQESIQVTLSQLIQLSKHYPAGDPRTAYDRQDVLAAAARFFERVLAEGDTAQTVPLRLLAQVHYGLGLTSFLQEDYGKAEAQYQHAQALQEGLIAAFPAELEHRLELALTWHGLSELYQAQRRQAEAKAATSKAVSLFAALPPDHPRLAFHVARLAQQLFTMNKLEESLPWQTRLVEQLEGTLPKTATPEGKKLLRSTLKWAHFTRALTYLQLQRPAEALPDLDRVQELEDNPSSPRWRIWRACALGRAGEYAAAAAELQKLAAQGLLDGKGLSEQGEGGAAGVMAAELYVAFREAALKDENLSPSEREKRAEEYAVRAVELLIRTRDAGLFKDAKECEQLRKNPDLADLREREDYRKFLASLEERSKGGK